MLANLNKTRGLIYSSKVLLHLVDTGITREDAYKIVQENAMATWREVQQCEPCLLYTSSGRPSKLARPSASVMETCVRPWASMSVSLSLIHISPRSSTSTRAWASSCWRPATSTA